jgi:Tol biopolymer transport system component
LEDEYLMIGRTLHHYHILRALGSGGMGEVYVAEDTKLHREVALKLLPRDMAEDPERLQRFQREAQAVAALNHPNVVTIYAVEEAERVHFITMELVEGKTLTDLIPERGFSLQEFLRLAVPLADAIAAAHQRGIVHRDLKPANIMVTTEGRLKVLDFGLAKLKQAKTGVPDGTTVTTDQLTMQHSIVGTPSYMSPEQAEGRPVDHRTDIFSAGVVLYEMATGKRPFRGESVVTILSSIIKDTPPPACDVNPSLPRELDRIIMHCLAKDPARRYQSALDLRNELEKAQQQAGSRTGLRVAAHALALNARRKVRWLALISLIALVAAGSYVFLRRNFNIRRAGPALLQASFSQLTGLAGAEQHPSMSPNGEWVVYSGEESGNRRIYLQNVGGQRPIDLTNDATVDDDEPAFSPDGKRIAFRSSREGGGIFVMGSTGEGVKLVSHAGFNPSWSPDNTRLVFATENVQLTPLNWEGRSELWIANVNTNETRLLTKEDAVQPSWSPHDRRIAYVARFADRTRQMHVSTIPVGGGKPTLVTSGDATDWSPVWSPDGKYIYYASDRGGSMNLWRVAMDEASGKPMGEPEAITTPAPFLAHPSVSADGKRIAYSAVLETQNIQRIAFDPATPKVIGEPAWVTRGSRRWSSPDISLDGQWLVFYSRVQPEGHLCYARADGTGEVRELPSDTAKDHVPRWSPDGNWIAFFSDRSANLQVWKIRRDGSERQQLTYAEGSSIATWSPNGSRIAVTNGLAAKTYVFDPNRPWHEQSPQVLPAHDASLRSLVVTSWSPDLEQLACQTGFNEGGSSAQLGIVTFSFKSGKYQRLTDYGEWPVWLGDSRHLLFVSKAKDFFVIDSQSKAVRKIFSVERDSIGPPRMTRDNRSIYFTRRVTEADIWLVTLR